ncbi:hsp70-binding protein 1-like [Argonauta hians]
MPGDQREDRIPSNMKDLLKFCMENTKAEDAPSAGASQVNELGSEDREWLEGALNSLTESPVRRMKECIRILKSPIRDNEDDEKEAALEELLEWCEYIDFAIDFFKIGGFDILPTLLHDPNSELRWRTLDLIAALVQNNPFCQKAVLDSELLNTMMDVLDNDSSTSVRIKALYAISCLCREEPTAQDNFIKRDGFSYLMRAMQADVEKLKIKSAFLLRNIVKQKPDVKETLCDMGMLEQLIGHLREDHSLFHEHLMACLLTILTDHPRSLEDSKQPQLQFTILLEEKLKSLHGRDEFREELQYTKNILQMLGSSGSDGISSVGCASSAGR